MTMHITFLATLPLRLRLFPVAIAVAIAVSRFLSASPVLARSWPIEQMGNLLVRHANRDPQHPIGCDDIGSRRGSLVCHTRAGSRRDRDRTKAQSGDFVTLHCDSPYYTCRCAC